MSSPADYALALSIFLSRSTSKLQDFITFPDSLEFLEKLRNIGNQLSNNHSCNFLRELTLTQKCISTMLNRSQFDSTNVRGIHSTLNTLCGDTTGATEILEASQFTVFEDAEVQIILPEDSSILYESLKTKLSSENIEISSKSINHLQKSKGEKLRAFLISLDGSEKKNHLKSCSSYLKLVAGEQHHLPVPFFFAPCPENAISLKNWCPPELFFDAQSLGSVHLYHHLKFGCRLWSNESDGFTIFCVQDCLVQSVRMSLGYEADHSVQAVSMPYVRIRHLSTEIRTKFNQSGNKHNISELKDQAACQKKRLDTFLKDPLWANLYEPRLASYRQTLDSLLKTTNRLQQEYSSENIEQLGIDVLRLEESIPTTTGALLSGIYPGKPQILVIDDHAAEEAERLKGTPLLPFGQSDDPPLTLDHLMSFDCFTSCQKVRRKQKKETSPSPGQLQIETEDRCAVCPSKGMCHESLLDQLCDLYNDLTANFAPHRYTAILLEVTFRCADYNIAVAHELLEICKRFNPSILALIHTHFGQDRLVVRSIEAGASWYSRKDQPHRLARSLFSIVDSSSPQNLDFDNSQRAGEERCEMPSLASVLKQCESRLPFGVASAEAEGLIRSALKSLPGNNYTAEPLTGGIGGSVTLKVYRRCPAPFEAGNEKLLATDDGPPPSIVKIDRTAPMRGEYHRYYRFIRPFIDNNVGRIAENGEFEGWRAGVIVYNYAGNRQGKGAQRDTVRAATLGQLFESNLRRDVTLGVSPFEEYQPILDNLFYDILPRLHRIREETHPDSYLDYPNPYFEEHWSPCFGYQIRLPVSATIDATNLTLSDSTLCSLDSTEVRAWKIGDQVKADGLVIRGISANSIYCLPLSAFHSDIDDGDVDIPHLQLRGDFIGHCIHHRALQPQQVIKITGQVTSSQSCIWEKLLSDIPKSIFPEIHEDGSRDEILRSLFSELNPDNLGDAKQDPGIIHGDLNLGNVIVECQEIPAEGCASTLIPFSQMPWLIDFARTRRGSSAFDLAEFESVVCSTLLAEEEFGGNVDERRSRYFSALGQTPGCTPSWVRKNPRLEFVFDLAYYLRRVAGKMRLSDRSYFAHLTLSNLVTSKVFGLGRSPQIKIPSRKLALAAAEAAYKSFISEGE